MRSTTMFTKTNIVTNGKISEMTNIVCSADINIAEINNRTRLIKRWSHDVSIS